MNKKTLHSLVHWFEEVRESYFFRENRNPYRVWVSEVVLQQTRIQAALAPLQRFFDCFPDVSKLANATEEEVVFAFRGLGYYSRARNLRKGALYIVSKCAGKLPEEYEELLKIPSIGPYTAAAISSICFGKRHPVCDGNVKRVLIRFMQWDLSTSNPEAHQKSIDLLQPLYSKINFSPGDSNEAIMELGQKICLRTNPKCDICPISQNCCSHQHSVVAKYPLAKERPKPIEVTWHLFLVADGKNVIVQHWKKFYFLQKQISFPSILEFVEDKKYISSWDKNIKNKEDMLMFLDKYNALKLPTHKHSITKHRIIIQPYCIQKKWQEKTSINLYEKEHYDNVPNKLVSSALIKVWKNFLKCNF